MTSETNRPGLLCPTCRVDLVMSERQGIEIDYCPQCRGVWLDRGELDKIIERSIPDAPAQPSMGAGQSGYGDRHGGGHGGGHGKHGFGGNRRKGFLRELFD